MPEITMQDLGPCQAKQPMIEPGKWQLCGREAAAKHLYMCVHEHMKEGATCPEHHPLPGAVGCSECWDLGHECPMEAQEIGRNDL